MLLSASADFTLYKLLSRMRGQSMRAAAELLVYLTSGLLMKLPYLVMFETSTILVTTVLAVVANLERIIFWGQMLLQ
jgi:hypothetical protein